MLQLRSAIHQRRSPGSRPDPVEILRRGSRPERSTTGDIADDVATEIDNIVVPKLQGYAVYATERAVEHFDTLIPGLVEKARPIVRELAADALSSEALQAQLATAREELKNAFVTSTLVAIATTILANLFLPPLFFWGGKRR